MSGGRGVRLQTLGRWRVLRGEEAVGGRLRGKAAALLAYLTFYPDRQLTRDNLAALFWPDQSSGAARNNLRQTLHQIRKATDGPDDPPLLVTSRTTVGIHPDCPLSLDAHTLLAPLDECEGPDRPETCTRCLGPLEERVALYRGPFLADWEVPGAMEDFEEWLEATREQLHRQAQALLGRLTACNEALGDPTSALRHARRALELDPAFEEGHRTVMRLLGELGQPQAGLAQFRSCCRLLESELAVEPDPATVALAQELRAKAVTAEGQTDGPGGAAPEGRRQVTVVAWRFDLPPGTDPEQAGTAREAAAARAVQEARARGGHALRCQDGGVVAYFGFPRAWEGATIEAVHAARRVTTGLGSDMAVAAGVHSGVVVHTRGTSGAPDPGGTATAPAIRASHRAAAGEVWATEAVGQMVQGYFELGPAVEDTPTESFAPVLAETGAAHRLEALGVMGRVPLLGRRQAMARLEESWAAVERGRGRAILIRGEAGIGKSRLVRAMAEQVAGRAHLAREYRCLASQQDTPYHPLITGLPKLFQLAADTPVEQAMARVEAFLAEVPGLPEPAPYLVGRLLGLPVAERYPDPGLTPQEEKRRTQQLLFNLAVQRGEGRPQVLVLEDLHWADASTREVVSYFIQAVQHQPLLLVLTSREPAPAVAGAEQLESLNLEPLSADELDELVAGLDPEGQLPDGVRREIIARSDGVPLFAEELTRVALDSGASGGLDQAFPLPLADLMGARLDWLDPERRLIPLAATLGRDFPKRLLAKVVDLAPEELDQRLQDLVQAGVLQPLPGRRDAWFQFRHALIQEAAYRSQLSDARRRSHSLVADAITGSAGDLARSQPGMVAHHLYEAGRWDEALAFWLAAAQRTFGQSANAEAAALASRGLSLAVGLTETPERRARWRQLLRILGRARVNLYGYSVPSVVAAFRSALELGPPEELSASERFEAIWGLWLGAAARGGHEEGQELAAELQALADQIGGPCSRRGADYASACTAFWLGDLARGERYARQGAGWDAPDAAQWHTREAAQARVECLGFDTVALSLSYLGLIWWHQGWPERALAPARHARELADALGHPYTRGAALAYMVAIRYFRREPDTVRELARELAGLAAEGAHPLHHSWGRLLEVWADAVGGDASGLAVLEDWVGVKEMRAAATGLGASALVRMAEALAGLGYRERALEVADLGLQAAAGVGDRITRPELYKVRGEVQTESAPEAAEADLHRALEGASAVGSVGCAVQAANQLARLTLRAGRLERLRHRLQTELDRLGEGHELPDAACLARTLGG